MTASEMTKIVERLRTLADKIQTDDPDETDYAYKAGHRDGRSVATNRIKELADNFERLIPTTTPTKQEPT